MSALILHHYPSSPFAQKIRSVLGFKQLAWKSVIIPSISPNPDLVALTGGYRKTPVLQVGADIYCDTALICDVLEHIQPEPVLYPPHLKGVSRVFAQWADSTLFWASMAYNLQPKGAEMLFASLPPAAAQAFAEDRKAMSAGMVRQRPQDATAAYRSYLRRIAHMVEEHDFLFGTELNEAFAAQSLAVIRTLGLNTDVVNPMGGAIALGHPLGATGAIRSATVVHALQRENLKYGMVTMCVGMGQGAAGIFERV